jgi:hypothetical protein
VSSTGSRQRAWSKHQRFSSGELYRIKAESLVKTSEIQFRWAIQDQGRELGQNIRDSVQVSFTRSRLRAWSKPPRFSSGELYKIKTESLVKTSQIQFR